MILPFTKEIIKTRSLSLNTHNNWSLRYNLICGYEFKSPYTSCGYSKSHGTNKFNSIAKNGCAFEKISLNWIRFFKLMAFRMLRNRQRPQHLMINHILTIGLFLVSSRRKATLNPYSISRLEFGAVILLTKLSLDNSQLPNVNVYLRTDKKMAFTLQINSTNLKAM